MHMRTSQTTRCDEEEAFRKFSEVFDLEVFALELEYNDRLGETICQAVRRESDRKQANFDAILADHPATLAGNVRRSEARRLESARLQTIAARKEERKKRSMDRELEHLAQKWRAQLIPPKPAQKPAT